MVRCTGQLPGASPYDARRRVPVGHQGHGGVAVAIAVAPGRRHEPLDLCLGHVLPCPRLGVGRPLWGNCSFHGGFDQLEVRFAMTFGLSRESAVRRTVILSPVSRIGEAF
jgi:hypothetical protein